MAERGCRRLCSLKVWGAGGLGGELDHLLPACPVGLPAFRVVPLQEAGLLSAVAAGAVQGLEDLVKGNDSPLCFAEHAHAGTRCPLSPWWPR